MKVATPTATSSRPRTRCRAGGRGRHRQWSPREPPWVAPNCSAPKRGAKRRQPDRFCAGQNHIGGDQNNCADPKLEPAIKMVREQPKRVRCHGKDKVHEPKDHRHERGVDPGIVRLSTRNAGLKRANANRLATAIAHQKGDCGKAAADRRGGWGGPISRPGSWLMGNSLTAKSRMMIERYAGIQRDPEHQAEVIAAQAHETRCPQKAVPATNPAMANARRNPNPIPP